MNVLIIAEAGVNHNGRIDLARNLVDAAAEAGADYIKFQTFTAEKIVTKDAGTAAYQKKGENRLFDSQYALLKKVELSEEAHREIKRYCEKRGICYISTGFDMDSIDFLDKLNVPLFKIPSGEITNKPLIRHIAQKGKPVIMSTGMAGLEEIEAALHILVNNGLSKNQITILHCNTEYPTPLEDVNLKAMLGIQKRFNVQVGYSDHTLGIEVPVAAVALGATVIEKHFTLDRGFPGPDHKASLEPPELKAMVTAIRNVEKAIAGNGIKEPTPSEMKNIRVVRKSIVASRAIAKGEIFSEHNLTTKRPGNGISPMLWDEVIGKKAKKNFYEDELIET